MSKDLGRNTLCPCGSGKKYKNCCQKKGVLFNKKSQNKIALFVLGGVVFLAAIVSISKMTSSNSLTSSRPVSQQPLSSSGSLPAGTQTSSQTGNTGGFIPQPGPAPPGKVWSPEHGHWHDAVGTPALPSTTSPMVQSTQLSPQPEGPAPEGKVWSAEHGHWHDAPNSGVAATPINPQSGNTANPSPVFDITPGDLNASGQSQSQSQTKLTPQPPGPAPEGKVWSPEHGHWHDAPLDIKTIQETPAKTEPK